MALTSWLNIKIRDTVHCMDLQTCAKRRNVGHLTAVLPAALQLFYVYSVLENVIDVGNVEKEMKLKEGAEI